jgi:hypothetical protein
VRYCYTVKGANFLSHDAACRVWLFFSPLKSRFCTPQRVSRSLAASNNLGDFMEQPPPIQDQPPEVSVSAQHAVEDTALQITGVSVTDLGALASGSPIGLTLQVADGTLFLQTNVANGVTAGEIGGEGTNTITIIAEQEAINATLAANGLIYTPGLNFNGNDALTVTADDFRNAVVAKQAAITVSAVNDAPVLTHAGPSASMHGFTVLDPDLNVTDAGLDKLNGGAGNYAGATFTIERQGGGNPDDGFYIDSSSGITVGANNVLQINGQTFATASVANNSLTISFTSSGTIATSALVDNFLQHIGYENSNATPGSNVTLDYTFDDGAPHFGSNAGHSTATASIQVNITGPIFAHETSSVYAPPHVGAVLEPGLTVSDSDLDKLNGGAGNYDGATFTIERDGGGNLDDGYFIDTSSGIALTAPNNQLQVNGQTVATASVDNGALTISFNSSATTAAVDNVMEHIGYENTNSAPPDSVTLDYTFDDGLATATSSVQAFVAIACYCAGTLILTDHGEVPVEALQIGDRLITASSVARPIKWIGKRSYGGRFIMGRKDILPIRFKTGSLGDNCPKRDLWISPHHAMYLQGVLVEAKDLVNGASIVQAEYVDKVEYFHVELESHDVIIAEGAASETFIDDDSRGMFHNAHEFPVLYPETACVPVCYCAPRRNCGYEVETARRLIETRAKLRATANDVGNLSLRGFVDAVSAERVAGWAQNPDHPEAPVCLDIFAGGQLIGQVLANRYREDLKFAGLGSGWHSFDFVSRAGLDLSSVAVEVRRCLDGAVVASAHHRSPAAGSDDVRTQSRMTRY